MRCAMNPIGQTPIAPQAGEARRPDRAALVDEDLPAVVAREQHVVPGGIVVCARMQHQGGAAQQNLERHRILVEADRPHRPSLQQRGQQAESPRPACAGPLGTCCAASPGWTGTDALRRQGPSAGTDPHPRVQTEGDVAIVRKRAHEMSMVSASERNPAGR